MTTQQLDHLEQLASAATPGPWHPGHLGNDAHPCNCPHVLSELYCGSICSVDTDNGQHISEGGNDAPPLKEAQANQRFIAAAREAIPQLIQAVRAAAPVVESRPAGLITRCEAVLAEYLETEAYPDLEETTQLLADLRELLAAPAAPAAAVPQWVSIDTAPKDGTRILIGWQNGDEWEQRAAYWDKEFASAWLEEEVNGSQFGYRGAWTDGAVVSFGMEETADYAPTHWMPLPAAPLKGGPQQ